MPHVLFVENVHDLIKIKEGNVFKMLVLIMRSSLIEDSARNAAAL